MINFVHKLISCNIAIKRSVYISLYNPQHCQINLDHTTIETHSHSHALIVVPSIERYSCTTQLKLIG